MAVDVDPPENFLDQFREGDKWVNPDNTLTPQARHYLEQAFFFSNSVWEKLGGPEDEIANTAIRESYAWDTASDDSRIRSAEISQLYPAEQVVERPFNYQVESAPKEFRCFTVSGGSYTAIDHDYINAKSSALICFPEYPSINATFTTRNGDGSMISLNGNGRMLNGCSTGIIDEKDASIDWHYFIDTDEWFSK